jgi:hypothetical protein
VKYDDTARAVLVLARNGKVPPLSLPAAAFVDAASSGARLELLGAFGADIKIACRSDAEPQHRLQLLTTELAHAGVKPAAEERAQRRAVLVADGGRDLVDAVLRDA